MYLINTETYELRDFTGTVTPPYAILSHTWGDDEVTFRHMTLLGQCRQRDGSFLLRDKDVVKSVLDKKGFKKIKHTCEEAIFRKLEWAWVDTCCIDKTSSAELSEAINSMFAWYRGAQICFAFLEDVKEPSEDDSSDAVSTDSAIETDLGSEKDSAERSDAGEFRSSSEKDSPIWRFPDPGELFTLFRGARWFTRGWTLQELIAPPEMHFYSAGWRYITSRSDGNCGIAVSKITGIPRALLNHSKAGPDGRIGLQALTGYSVAQRMSWAAHRQCTRTEDVAYCLLGLFDVNMPLLYGEGTKAFKRLQEEIFRTIDDHSLLAWTAPKAFMTVGHPQLWAPHGVFADNPNYFARGKNVRSLHEEAGEPSTLTKKGLRLAVKVMEEDTCSPAMQILLRRVSPGVRLKLLLLNCGMTFEPPSPADADDSSSWTSSSLVSDSVSINDSSNGDISFASTGSFSAVAWEERNVRHVVLLAFASGQEMQNDSEDFVKANWLVRLCTPDHIYLDTDETLEGLREAAFKRTLDNLFLQTHYNGPLSNLVLRHTSLPVLYAAVNMQDDILDNIFPHEYRFSRQEFSLEQLSYLLPNGTRPPRAPPGNARMRAHRLRPESLASTDPASSERGEDRIKLEDVNARLMMFPRLRLDPRDLSDGAVVHYLASDISLVRPLPDSSGSERVSWAWTRSNHSLVVRPPMDFRFHAFDLRWRAVVVLKTHASFLLRGRAGPRSICMVLAHVKVCKTYVGHRAHVRLGLSLLSRKPDTTVYHFGELLRNEQRETKVTLVYTDVNRASGTLAEVRVMIPGPWREEITMRLHCEQPWDRRRAGSPLHIRQRSKTASISKPGHADSFRSGSSDTESNMNEEPGPRGPNLTVTFEVSVKSRGHNGQALSHWAMLNFLRTMDFGLYAVATGTSKIPEDRRLGPPINTNGLGESTVHVIREPQASVFVGKQSALARTNGQSAKVRESQTPIPAEKQPAVASSSSQAPRPPRQPPPNVAQPLYGSKPQRPQADHRRSKMDQWERMMKKLHKDQ
jgi:hypothetical protein